MDLSRIKEFLNKIKPWGMCIILPGYFLYAEIVLALLGGSGFPNPLFCFAFSAAGGLIAAGIFSLVPERKNIIVLGGLLAVTALLFSVEAIVRSVFRTYMEPFRLLSGASGVASGYGSELTRSIFFGLPKAALFIAPDIPCEKAAVLRGPADRGLRACRGSRHAPCLLGGGRKREP